MRRGGAFIVMPALAFGAGRRAVAASAPDEQLISSLVSTREALVRERKVNLAAMSKAIRAGAMHHLIFRIRSLWAQRVGYASEWNPAIEDLPATVRGIHAGWRLR